MSEMFLKATKDYTTSLIIFTYGGGGNLGYSIRYHHVRRRIFTLFAVKTFVVCEHDKKKTLPRVDVENFQQYLREGQGKFFSVYKKKKKWLWKFGVNQV